MDIRADHVGECRVLRLKGRLDLAGAGDADKFLTALAKHGEGCLKLVLDFEGVDFISSSGLRVLVSSLSATRAAGGDLVLCKMNVAVEEVFAFSGLDTVFRIFREEAEALSALAAGVAQERPATN